MLDYKNNTFSNIIFQISVDVPLKTGISQKYFYTYQTEISKTSFIFPEKILHMVPSQKSISHSLFMQQFYFSISVLNQLLLFIFCKIFIWFVTIFSLFVLLLFRKILIPFTTFVFFDILLINLQTFLYTRKKFDKKIMLKKWFKTFQYFMQLA